MTPDPQALSALRAEADDHCIAEFRRAVRDAVHPTTGKCGPDSTGCAQRHHLAWEEAINLLGRGDFALARRLLWEYDTARLPAASPALDVNRLAQAIDLSGIGFANSGVLASDFAPHIAAEYARLAAEEQGS